MKGKLGHTIHFFFFLLVCVASVEGAEPTPPADISFLIADYKYNEEQGVKICEVQIGPLTVFTAYDGIYGVRGLLADHFCDFFSHLEPNLWYTPAHLAEDSFRFQCRERGWIPVSTVSDLKQSPAFLEAAQKPVNDPRSLDDVHGMLYTSVAKIPSMSTFRKDYPGILVLGAATFPFWSDKLAWSKLLSLNPELQNFKPLWKEYPRIYTKTLASEILADLSSEIVVIKPRNAFCGDGVLLVKRMDLDRTLKRILKNKKKLKKSKDPSYSYWSHNHDLSFIVEEFIPSDPVAVPKFHNALYDGTARSVFLLTHDRGEINVHFLETHWKLPSHSLDQSGTLNKLHKSAGPMYCEMHPVTQKKLQSELEKGLRLLYHEMLHFPR